MPLYARHEEGRLVWGIWQMDECPDADKRTREHEAVYRLLEQLCGGPVEVEHEPSGKPYLKNSTWHVSISHTKGYAAVALHPDCEVGIDIEHYTDRVCRVQTKFLSSEELAGVDGENVGQLLVYWCAKEAVYKALNIEGTELRSHIRVLPFSYSQTETEGTCTAVELKTGTRKEFPLRYILAKEFVLTYTLIQ